MAKTRAALSRLLGWGRRRVPSRTWAGPAGPIKADLRAVEDFAVFERYPVNRSRTTTTIPWLNPEPRERILTVFEVANAIVSKHHQVSDLVNGWFFANQTYEHVANHPRPGATFALEIEKCHAIEGRVFIIGGASLGNYFHNLLNWVSRLVVAEQVAPELFHDPTIRFMLDYELAAEPFRSMLDMLGIAADRIVWTDYREDYAVERALVVSFIHDGELCPEIFGLLARRLQKAAAVSGELGGKRRIWISREELRVGRQIANISEIADLLARHDFERIALERLSFADQVRLFAEAEVIAGSHGAGFANLIFCPPGAHALVIEKDFSLFLGFNNVFKQLALSHGLTYEYLHGETIELPGVDYSQFIPAHTSDVRVDPAIFAEALSRCAPIRGSNAKPKANA